MLMSNYKCRQLSKGKMAKLSLLLGLKKTSKKIYISCSVSLQTLCSHSLLEKKTEVLFPSQVHKCSPSPSLSFRLALGPFCDTRARLPEPSRNALEHRGSKEHTGREKDQEKIGKEGKETAKRY